MILAMMIGYLPQRELYPYAHSQDPAIQAVFREHPFLSGFALAWKKERTNADFLDSQRATLAKREKKEQQKGIPQWLRVGELVSYWQQMIPPVTN